MRERSTQLFAEAGSICAEVDTPRRRTRQPLADHRAGHPAAGDTMSAGPPLVEMAGRWWPLTLSTAEAAAFLGCSTQRLRAERNTGRLPIKPLELGNRLRWPTLKVAEAVGLDARLSGGPHTELTRN